MLGLFKSKKKSDKVTVLVVDDDPTVTMIIERYLEKHGYEVIKAVNGQEGLDLTGSRNPDIIILDTVMPVMTGHEMLKVLRKNPQTRDLPVIMCTSKDDIHDIALASLYNVSAYLTKPFDLINLTENIESILARPALR
jgi:CheY-like chemotaxis protein